MGKLADLINEARAAVEHIEATVPVASRGTEYVRAVARYYALCDAQEAVQTHRGDTA